MDARRERLRQLLRRRRRMRLLAVSVVTAAACGLVAGLLAPEILVGGVVPRTPPVAAAKIAPEPAGVRLPMQIGERLGLDPREVRANAIRWASLPEARRLDLLDDYWRLADLEPEERDRLIERYVAFRSEPKERRDFLRVRAERVREFVRSLSAQDQAELSGMSERERAERLVQLWANRYGTGEW